MRVVAGDIGGTKTLLQLVEVTGAGRSIVVERRYESGAYPTFDAMLHEFLSMSPEPVRCACFAIAGPVVDAKSQVTNLGWNLAEADLQHEFSIPRVILLNDFFAVAAGVPLLGSEDVSTIQHGQRDRTWPVAILGAGTGLGEAFVVPEANGWRVVPSEGGHADFAPRGELQTALLAFLEQRYGHVSYERLLSGHGLVNIFTFMRDQWMRDAATYTENLPDDADLPAWIATKAAGGDRLARATFDVFIDIYGAEAGNLALKLLSKGGVYVAGGIATKNLDRFMDGRFVAAFRDKGRFASFMEQFPIDVIANAKVGLIGAAEIAVKCATG